MECTIPGINVKVFGRAIHSLAKIGEELYVEPLPNGLALRTVNSSRSAYGCFIFAPSFFVKYAERTKSGLNGADEEPIVRCRMLMKSCLSVFKSLSTLERTVDNCKINLNANQSVMRFQLQCRHGIVKTYNLTFIECETLQAIYSKDMSPNVLTAQSRLLCDVVVNFQPSHEEVTLCLTPEKVSMKNHVDDEPDSSKVMRTEMTLAPEEFETFQAGVDCDVTFCLKELRAILSFSEAGNLPVTVRFQSAGMPIVFSLDSEATYEANFVLATLATGTSDTRRESVDTVGQRNNMTSGTPRIADASTVAAKSTSKRMGKKHKLYSTNHDLLSTNQIHDNKRVEATTGAWPGSAALLSPVPAPDTANLVNSVALGDGASVPDDWDADPFEVMENVSATVDVDFRASDKLSSLRTGDGDSKFHLLPVSMLTTDDEADDTLPPTPPNKKFKSLFFGSQVSQPSPKRTDFGRVLVADSDEEG